MPKEITQNQLLSQILLELKTYHAYVRERDEMLDSEEEDFRTLSDERFEATTKAVGLIEQTIAGFMVPQQSGIGGKQ